MAIVSADCIADCLLVIPYEPLDRAKVRDPFLVGRQGLCVEGLPLAAEDRSEGFPIRLVGARGRLA